MVAILIKLGGFRLASTGTVEAGKTGVSGKGGYGRTQAQTWMRTRTISKYTFTFTQHLLFIPNVVFTTVFTSQPWHL